MMVYSSAGPEAGLGRQGKDEEMSWWRRLLNRPEQNDNQVIDADRVPGNEADTPRTAEFEPSWPTVPQLSAEQKAAETARLKGLLEADLQILKELMSQPEPHGQYLNLLVKVGGEFRGQISLTGPDIDQRRQRLEQTFGLTTEAIEDSSVPPTDGNSLTIVQTRQGRESPSLTVWFGPAMQKLYRSYIEWLTLYGDQDYATGGDLLIVTSRDN